MSKQITLTTNEELYSLLKQKAKKEYYATVQELINSILRKELLKSTQEKTPNKKPKQGSDDALVDFISKPRRK